MVSCLQVSFEALGAFAARVRVEPLPATWAYHHQASAERTDGYRGDAAHGNHQLSELDDGPIAIDVVNPCRSDAGLHASKL